MSVPLVQRLKQNILGILACLSFFFGSLLFLPTFAQYATVGVWLFMTGSVLMLVSILCPFGD